MRTTTRWVAVVCLMAASFGGCGEEEETTPPPERFPGGTDPLPALPSSVTLPIVFVHGFAGSAAQYQSQAMRFVANGYPADRIVAYDHDGAGFDFGAYVAGVDAVIDQALADFNVEQVYLVGHSRGTLVSSMYLGDATRAAKVAKYIALDGQPCPDAVPCIAPTQALIPGQAHVEVATSAESFAMQYEFLIGEAPEVVDIVNQALPVEISGRAVTFPANTGRAASTLRLFELDETDGSRVSSEPIATFSIGADGNWGPVTIAPDKHYEAQLTGEASTTQHFYMQPFRRSTNLVRLLSGDPDAPTRVNTNVGDGHAAIIALRMREWMTTDVLEITTESASGDEATINAITADVGNDNIAIHIHDDAASPGESTLGPIEYFASQPFQAGVDVYMPASDPTDGTITLRNLPRGDATKPQVLSFPNWNSTDHMVMAVFNDYAD